MRTRSWVIAATFLFSTVAAAQKNENEAQIGNLARLSPKATSTFAAAVKSSSQGASFGADPAPVVSTHISAHLGFDTEYVYPVSVMEQWWTASPYYDVGIYLPGAENGPDDPNLKPAWASAVISQGWGIMPIWLGLQALCAGYKKNFGDNAAQARAYGVKDAGSAILSAQQLALGGNIIYLDLEEYPDSTQDEACDAAAGSFVQGWTDQLHSAGYLAGVYGQATNAISDWLGVPDIVWIKTWDKMNPVGPVAIWQILGQYDATAWNDQQRITQYERNIYQSWGGSAAQKLDLDIEDAPVTGLSTPPAKNHTFSAVPLDEGTLSFASGINNGGQVVGGYMDLAGKNHGFLYANGSFLSFDYPGATGTEGYGINNYGFIVGAYADSQEIVHGFEAQVSNNTVGDFVSLSCPGAINCYPNGVNDNYDVVGSYTDASGIWHGFLYDPHKTALQHFRTIDYPGQQNTNLTAINGDRIIVGQYNVTGTQQLLTGFVYEDNVPSPQFIPFYKCGLGSIAVGINNEGHIVGSTSSGDSFVYNGNTCTTIMLPGASFTYAAAISDSGQSLGGQLTVEQVVGFAGTFSPPTEQSFIATPN